MKLDAHQAAAAMAGEPRILVSAVPGSGKTRTLTARYLHLVDDLHISPYSIVLLTFTRYAANEMKERLGDRARNAFIGTFHSFALFLVRAYGRERGWDSSWLTILDDGETTLDEREILRDMRVMDSRGKWKRCKEAEWLRIRNAIACGQFDEKTASPTEIILNNVWQCLEDRFRAENVLTFSTLILEAIRLLQMPDVLALVKERYTHFLIDEAQDSDANQTLMIDLIDPPSRFLVGDIDQAIFEWRGAAPQLFLAYAKTAARYDLPNSYRFGFNVGLPANRLIKHNQERLDIAINAIAGNAGTVQVILGAASSEVAELVLTVLKTHGPKEVAILSRTHAVLDELSEALRYAGVKHCNVGAKGGIVKTAEFRAVRGYLRLSVNPMDRRAFMSIAASEHISSEKLLDNRLAAVASGKTLAQVHTEAGNTLPTTIDEIEEHLKNVDPAHGYGDALDYMREAMFAENIVTTAELVEVLAMESAQDRLRAVKNEVTLCTIHAAKGLEWPCVFLVGMNASRFPSRRAIGEGRIEEERRLCYVGMTRAERTLYLVSHMAKDEKDGPSMFVGETELDGGPPPRETDDDDLTY